MGIVPEPEELESASSPGLKPLPFGVIKLDASGVILNYNAFRNGLTEQREPGIIGSHFFDDFAPCPRVREFEGSFRSAVEQNTLREVFDLDFDHTGDSVPARIRMVSTGESEPGAWIFITPLRQLKPL